MRTISLRRFRDSIADLTEPVEVQRRDKAGNFQVLGRWEPLSGGAAAVIDEETGWPRAAIMGAEDYRALSESDPSRGPRAQQDKTSQRAIDRAKEFLLLSAEPGDLAYTRKAQQAQRDTILRKINRGG